MFIPYPTVFHSIQFSSKVCWRKPHWSRGGTTGPIRQIGQQTSSIKGNLSDFSYSTNGLSPAPSLHETLITSPAPKAGQRAMSHTKSVKDVPHLHRRATFNLLRVKCI